MSVKPLATPRAMNEAESRVIAAHLNLLNMSIYSSTLLSVVNFGLHHASRDNTFFTDPLRRIAPHLDDASLAEMSKLTRELTTEQAIQGAQAACLIFIHAGCESALTNVAKVAATEPTRWHEIITKKQLTVGDLIGTASEEIIRQKIDEHIVEFDRDSLIRKTRTLFRLYQPCTSALPGYIFSEERLQRIDALRHRCAHGGCGVADFSTFDDDLEYLRQTGEYFVRLAAVAFKIDLHEPHFKPTAA